MLERGININKIIRGCWRGREEAPVHDETFGEGWDGNFLEVPASFAGPATLTGGAHLLGKTRAGEEGRTMAAEVEPSPSSSGSCSRGRRFLITQGRAVGWPEPWRRAIAGCAYYSGVELVLVLLDLGFLRAGW